MSELWLPYGDNTVPPDGASEEMMERCRLNHAQYNVARNALFIALATYFALAGLLRTQEVRTPAVRAAEKKQTDAGAVVPEAILPQSTPFDPLSPAHDGELPVVVE